jgi:predicted alpha/beta hydrolase family esterase
MAALGRALVEKTVLLVPGLRGSGPAHWQTLWQAKHPEYRRVLQQDWAAARLDAWTAALDGAINATAGPVFIVAHGFGCLAAIQRLAVQRAKVAGALLVAPRDPCDFGLDPSAPDEPFDFPTTLVASRNDPWMPLRQARRLARRLGSRFVDAGHADHIDAASGYGPWPKGEQLLAGLFARARAQERALQLALALAA